MARLLRLVLEDELLSASNLHLAHQPFLCDPNLSLRLYRLPFLSLLSDTN
jgi:hypothetical protein